MRHAALAVGASDMNHGKRLVRMAEVLIQYQRVVKSFFIARCTLSLEHGHLAVEVIAGFFVGHKRGVCRCGTVTYLTEVILELLEDAALGGGIALEIVTLTELFDGALFVAGEGLRHVDTDINHQITVTASISLNGR